jgi:hypothetical protein
MKNHFLLGLALLLIVSLFGCRGGANQDASRTGTGNSGTLSLSLMDASTDQYKAVYITIEGIQVHLGGEEGSPGNWESVEMPVSPITVNLLELVNGVREDLGLVSLPEGHYTQMRLMIGREPDSSVNVLGNAHPHANYVIKAKDPAEIHELRVPSGHQSGVKIVQGFDISADQTTELILDFDAALSVVEAGNSGNWNLKPTIRVAELQTYAIITGLVTSENDGVGIEGARVTLQRYDASAADPMDQVTVKAASVTDENGFYQLFVEQGQYNLVVVAPGKQVFFSQISAAQNDADVHEAILKDAAQGRVDADLDMSGADTVEQFASLSVRKTAADSEGEQVLEIGYFNILNGASYSISLPAGSYTIVTSSHGYQSESFPVTVMENATSTQHIELNVPAQ